MAKSSYSSDEEEEEVNAPTYDELINSFDELNENFDGVFKLNKILKKKNKSLETENEVLQKRVYELENNSNDHSSCLLEQQKLCEEIDRLKKEFSYVVGKFTSGQEKFEKLLSLQRFSSSKNGLGCDPYQRKSSLMTKFSNNENSSITLGVPTCDKCLKIGHSLHSCTSLRRTIKVKKMWIPKGTTLPNLVHMTNTQGPKLAWVPLKRNKIIFVGTSQE